MSSFQKQSLSRCCSFSQIYLPVPGSEGRLGTQGPAGNSKVSVGAWAVQELQLSSNVSVPEIHIKSSESTKERGRGGVLLMKSNHAFRQVSFLLSSQGAGSGHVSTQRAPAPLGPDRQVGRGCGLQAFCLCH